jgi:fermentation-respiration switch protein FrsA (DUF1100 family)
MPVQSRRRRLKKWPFILLLVLFGGGAYGGLRYYEREVLYRPDREIAATPKDTHRAYRDVEFFAPDGVGLHGWWVPAEAGGVAATHPTILFLHGNQGNLSGRLQKIGAFHDLGFNVFILSYRGYGRSQGAPGEQGLYNDALAAYYWLQREGVPPEKLFLYGEALGANVAIHLATQVRAAGLITEAAAGSMRNLVLHHHPRIPWDWVMSDRYESLEKIRRIHMPLLLVHSRDDETVPFHEAQRLLERARDPKQLVALRGAHIESFTASFDELSDALLRFVAEHGGGNHVAGATPAATDYRGGAQ